MHAIATDRGPRAYNEDRAACVRLQTASGTAATILVVCDGVGGSAHGEIAADLGVGDVSGLMTGYLISSGTLQGDLRPEDALEALVQSITTANSRIVEEAERDPEFHGMATTIVCAVFIGRLLLIAWVGDSRAYLFRDRELRRLTVDHSETQRLVDAGLLTPEGAEVHPLRHCIYRSLGRLDGFQVDTRMLHLCEDDEILLSSDGLTDSLPEAVIAEILANGLLPVETAETLIRTALSSNPTDNTTVALFQPEPELKPHHRTLTRGFANAFALASAQNRGDHHD